MVTTVNILASCLMMVISLTQSGAQLADATNPVLSPACEAQIKAASVSQFGYLAGPVARCMALLKTGDSNLTSSFSNCNATDADTYKDDVKQKCESDIPEIGKELLKLPAICTATIDRCVPTGPTIKGLFGEEKYCEAMSYSTALEDTKKCLTGYPFSKCTVAEFMTLKDAACSGVTLDLSLITSLCSFLIYVIKMAA